MLLSKTFCEFFAGIGLVREGLSLSDWECVYANDIDSKKQQIYAARFGQSDEFQLEDVWRTESVVGRIPGRPALATASFPCIDLSLAGHYKGLKGNHSSTFFGFAEVIRAMAQRRPPLLMLENVNGLLTSNKGRDFAAIAHTLADLGYWLDAFVVDARHFTPQSRPRVFIVGALSSAECGERSENPDSPRSTPHASRSTAPSRPPAIARFKRTLKLATGWLTLPIPELPERGIALADVIDVDEAQEWWGEAEVKRHYAMMSPLHQSRVEEILASKQRWVGTAFRRIRNKTMRAEVRFDGLAGCLRTPKGGSAKQIVVMIERGRLRMRWMSPREYARLQGAPDFPLAGGTIQQWWGFADAVCVPAIAWIDQYVLTPLYESISCIPHAAESETSGATPASRRTAISKGIAAGDFRPKMCRTRPRG